jgi:DNA-binding protein H-NS
MATEYCAQLADELGLAVDDIAPKRHHDALQQTEWKAGEGGRFRQVPRSHDGKTWSGRGTAPTWIEKYQNRFLIVER